MKVKPPEEDPRTKAARERAEQLAEQQLVSETQRRLEDTTAAFTQRFGARAAVGGIPAGFAARQASKAPQVGFRFGGLGGL